MEDELIDMKSNIFNAETVKALVLDKLLEDDIITKETHEIYYTQYYLIIIKPNWFKIFINKFNKESEKNFVYKYVKF